MLNASRFMMDRLYFRLASIHDTRPDTLTRVNGWKIGSGPLLSDTMFK